MNFFYFHEIKHSHLNKRRRRRHMEMTLGNAANPARSMARHTVAIPGSGLSNYKAGKKEAFIQLHNLDEFQQENIGGVNN